MPEVEIRLPRITKKRGDYSATEFYENYDSVSHDNRTWILRVDDTTRVVRGEPGTDGSGWQEHAGELTDVFEKGYKFYFHDGNGGLDTVDIGAEDTSPGIDSANQHHFFVPTSTRHNDEYYFPTTIRYPYMSYNYMYIRSLNKNVTLIDASILSTGKDRLYPAGTEFNSVVSHEQMFIDPAGTDVGGANEHTLTVEAMYESNGMQILVSSLNKAYGAARIKGSSDSSTYGLGLADYSDYGKNRRNFVYASPFNSIYDSVINASAEITGVDVLEIRTIVGCPLGHLTPGNFGNQTAFTNHENIFAYLVVVAMTGRIYTWGNYANGLVNNSFYTADNTIKGLLAFDGVTGVIDFYYGGDMKCGYCITATGVTYIGDNSTGEAGNGMNSGGITNKQHVMTGTDFSDIISIASIGHYDASNSWVGTFFLKSDGVIFRTGVLPHATSADRTSSIANTPTVIALPSSETGVEIVSNYGAGENSFVAVRSSANNVYMLGDFPADNLESITAFVSVTLPSGKTPQKLVAGYKQLIIIMTDGSVYITGQIYDNPNSGTAHVDNRFCLIDSSELRPTDPALILHLPEPMTDVKFTLRGFDATGLHIRYRLEYFGSSGKVYYSDSDHKRIRQIF